MTALVAGSFFAGLTTVWVFDIVGRLLSMWQRRRAIGVLRLPES